MLHKPCSEEIGAELVEQEIPAMELPKRHAAVEMVAISRC